MEDRRMSDDNNIKCSTDGDSGDFICLPPRPPVTPDQPSKKAKSDRMTEMGDISNEINEAFKADDLPLKLDEIKEDISTEDSGFSEKTSKIITEEDDTMNDISKQQQVPATNSISEPTITANNLENNENINPSEVGPGCSFSFPRSRSSSKVRNYKKISDEIAKELNSESSNDENGMEVCEDNAVDDSANDVKANNSTDTIAHETSDELTNFSSIGSDYGSQRSRSPTFGVSNSDGDGDSLGPTDLDEDKEEGPSNERTPTVLQKPKPKHNWYATTEILNRQIGLRGGLKRTTQKHKGGHLQFQQRYYGSLHAVQRLELMYKMEGHEGCVNSLSFNREGTLLASGSDDLRIILWKWGLGKQMTSFNSGHESNVFQSKFLGLQGDLHIASSARDGQVRLSLLGPDGLLRSTKKISQHRGMVHKLASVPLIPHELLSVGEDGLVIKVDLRDPMPERILIVKEDNNHRVPLYSIHCHPHLDHEFCVGGRDQYVRIYDRRNLSEPSSKLQPLSEKAKMENKAAKCNLHITAAVYNYNGNEIVASYSDDDVYLFDNSPESMNKDKREYIGRYSGHRNSATIKGVNFFGPRSEYIVSGSDCGYCYFWDKKTESIVQWFLGDETGVVNCLEPHPSVPVIATSGLDADVKIWIPSKEEGPDLTHLANVVRSNERERDCTNRSSDIFDGQMMWMFWSHIRRAEHVRRRNSRAAGLSTSSSSDSDDEVEENDGLSQQCSPS